MPNLMRKQIPMLPTLDSLLMREQSNLQIILKLTDDSSCQYRNALNQPIKKKRAAILACSSVKQWNTLISELKLLIGETAAMAIFQHCLYLSAKIYPWLMYGSSQVDTKLLLAHFEKQLTEQFYNEALAAQAILWNNGCALLVKLLGTELANQLIQKSTMLAIGELEQPVPIVTRQLSEKHSKQQG